VSVLEPSKLITEGEAVQVTTGKGFTVIADAAVPEQPPLNPVTVNVVLADGLTAIVAVVSPVLHKKLAAPLAVSVTDEPEQMETEDGVQVTTGAVFTVTVAEALAEHPFALVPVTVKVVVADGLTVMLADVAPVFHRKLAAPLAVSVTDDPAQMETEDGVQVTTGAVLTVTVVLAEAEQPPFDPVTV
jgi:hypothetical protein